MAAWKRKTRLRKWKVRDALARADLKSKRLSNKNAGEFQIQKRVLHAYTYFAGAKKPSQHQYQLPSNMWGDKGCRGRVGRVDDDDALCKMKTTARKHLLREGHRAEQFQTMCV
jgi:hypothetical protein